MDTRACTRRWNLMASILTRSGLSFPRTWAVGDTCSSSATTLDLLSVLKPAEA